MRWARRRRRRRIPAASEDRREDLISPRKKREYGGRLARHGRSKPRPYRVPLSFFSYAKLNNKVSAQRICHSESAAADEESRNLRTNQTLRFAQGDIAVVLLEGFISQKAFPMPPVPLQV